MSLIFRKMIKYARSKYAMSSLTKRYLVFKNIWFKKGSLYLQFGEMATIRSLIHPMTQWSIEMISWLSLDTNIRIIELLFILIIANWNSWIIWSTISLYLSRNQLLLAKRSIPNKKIKKKILLLLLKSILYLFN